MSKNENNSVPSWEFECQHGSKECVGNLLEVFLSVILIHQQCHHHPSFFLQTDFDAKMFNLSQVCVMAHMDWDFQAYLPVISCMEVFDDNREATIF